MKKKEAHNKDIIEILKMLKEKDSKFMNYHPYELYLRVYDIILARGMYPGHVNVKKVWRIYKKFLEEMPP